MISSFVMPGSCFAGTKLSHVIASSPLSGMKKLQKSSFKKSIETHFNRSKMFLFFTTHMMSICEKKKLTNRFMEFYYFMKKELDNYEDFFKLTGICRSSRWQMFFKIGALKTFYNIYRKTCIEASF